MPKSKKVATILFILIFYSTGFAQVGTVIDSSKSDSIKGESIYKLRFNSSHTKSLMSLKAPILFNSFSDYYLPEFENIEKPNSISSLESLRIKREMANSFNVIRQGLRKNDLGVVGEILGYTSAAATLGLAIYHVSKYHKYYGIK